MEVSKNARLSHEQPQGSTTEENSLGCWQEKQQRPVPRNKSNCPRGKKLRAGEAGICSPEVATEGPPGPGTDAERC